MRDCSHLQRGQYDWRRNSLADFLIKADNCSAEEPPRLYQTVAVST